METERTITGHRRWRPGRRVVGPACGSRSGLALLLAAAVILQAANVGLADRITKHDGTIMRGRIVKEDRDWVILETTKAGRKLTLPIPRKQIWSIHRGEEPDRPGAATRPATPPSPGKPGAGPGYYPLPIQGEIGIDVRAESLTAALKDARGHKPDFVVLQFDSKGGSAEEAGKLLDVLAEYKDLRLIAFVREAYASAAVVVLACKDIYVAPAGTIGGAAPDRTDPDGKSKPRSRKSRSKSKSPLHAKMLAAAKMGGHPALIARGLVEPDLQLVLVTEDGKTVVKEGKEGKVLKPEGELLRVTGPEAVNCGLAKGVAYDMPFMNETMGLKEWHKLPGGGWYLMTRMAREYRQELERAERKERREAYMKSIAPDLKRIDDKLKQVKNKGRDAEKDKRDLIRQYDNERDAIKSRYRAEMREAVNFDEDNPGHAAELRRRARDKRDREYRDLENRHRPRAKEIQATIRKMYREMKDLRAERSKLLAGAPK